MTEIDWSLTREEWFWIALSIIIWLLGRFVIFPILFGLKSIIDQEIDREERKKSKDNE